MHILERALSRGVELRDGFAVTGVAEQEDHVVVSGNAGELCRARYLVGADGAAGKVAAAVGLARRTRPALAIDTECEVTPAGWAAEGGRMSFNFGVVPGGYGWIFPKQGYLSCGVGSWTRAARLPGQLDAYLARALPQGCVKAERRRGHPIPIYEGPARVSTRRVLLAGDAASLVEPILGEGIRFALESGVIAAGVIGEALRGAALDDLEHSRRIHAAIGSQLDQLRRFVLPLFLKSPALFFERFIQEGQSYAALARELASRFPLPSPFSAF
jgi:flavin-dependent dehydrogenase